MVEIPKASERGIGHQLISPRAATVPFRGDVMAPYRALGEIGNLFLREGIYEKEEDVREAERIKKEVRNQEIRMEGDRVLNDFTKYDFDLRKKLREGDGIRGSAYTDRYTSEIDGWWEKQNQNLSSDVLMHVRGVVERNLLRSKMEAEETGHKDVIDQSLAELDRTQETLLQQYIPASKEDRMAIEAELEARVKQHGNILDPGVGEKIVADWMQKAKSEAVLRDEETYGPQAILSALEDYRLTEEQKTKFTDALQKRAQAVEEQQRYEENRRRDELNKNWDRQFYQDVFDLQMKEVNQGPDEVGWLKLIQRIESAEDRGYEHGYHFKAMGLTAIDRSREKQRVIGELGIKMAMGVPLTNTETDIADEQYLRGRSGNTSIEEDAAFFDQIGNVSSRWRGELQAVMKLQPTAGNVGRILNAAAFVRQMREVSPRVYVESVDEDVRDRLGRLADRLDESMSQEAILEEWKVIQGSAMKPDSAHTRAVDAWMASRGPEALENAFTADKWRMYGKYGLNNTRFLRADPEPDIELLESAEFGPDIKAEWIRMVRERMEANPVWDLHSAQQLAWENLFRDYAITEADNRVRWEYRPIDMELRRRGIGLDDFRVWMGKRLYEDGLVSTPNVLSYSPGNLEVLYGIHAPLIELARDPSSEGDYWVLLNGQVVGNPNGDGFYQIRGEDVLGELEKIRDQKRAKALAEERAARERLTGNTVLTPRRYGAKTR